MNTKSIRNYALSVLSVMAALTTSPLLTHAQATCERIMEQDSSLNNLVDPAGYNSAPSGSLGRVTVAGSGPQAIVFIPGLGFGGEVFQDYIDSHAEHYTAYLVTLPGFGGTQALKSPDEEAGFGDQTWTNSAVEAVEKMIENRGIKAPILVGHWLTGTQIALRLALKNPERMKAVVLVTGSACFMGDTTKFPAHPPIEKRVAIIDQYTAPKWFKTVTRATWDDNNFLPGDYAVNPVMGLRLWRQAAEPDMHVWVRYLCEFFAQDISLELDSLKVPTLLLKPGLEGNFVDGNNDYMKSYCHTNWDSTLGKNKMITAVTIPQSRVFIWIDQPEKFDVEFGGFVNSLE